MPTSRSATAHRECERIDTEERAHGRGVESACVGRGECGLGRWEAKEGGRTPRRAVVGAAGAHARTYFAHDAHVAEVERGVDLVHDVQRRRLVVVQREDERERGEGLLAAREVGDMLPRLLGRPHAEDDALGEGVERVEQLELRVATERDHLRDDV
eukprot:scaffold52749_cov71-Phaeocystis_antarctica.AAC.2